MSSEDVANYLIEIGSCERKLEYCRQILSQNSQFTPQTAFTLNTAQPKTTLSKNQAFELFKHTGLTANQQELELIFTYFQIDGKNYITLQQFSSVILTQTDSFQNPINKNEKTYGKYPLKYTLQKLFLQILENQSQLELLCKFRFIDKEESKFIYKKVNMDHLKTFLAAHGKYPTQNILDQILKAILLNKGKDKRHKLINKFILQFNQKISKQPNKIRQNQSQIQKNVNITNTNKSIEQNIPSISRNSEKRNFNANTTKTALQEINQNLNKGISTSNNQKANADSVQAKIKSLMSSINIKQNNFGQKEHSFTKNVSKFSDQKIRQQVKTIKEPSQFKPERQFSQISVMQTQRSRFEQEEKTKIRNKYQIQDYEVRKKIGKYRNSKINSQENGDNFSFNETSRSIFRSKNSKTLVSQNMKQNQKTTQAEINKKSENAKRIEYLKNLVRDEPTTKSKQIEVYRV